jgi:signal transduction histidine kinase
MRVLGWGLFAATCVMFALQGLFLAASNDSLISYEVLVDRVFPLLGIGAVVGAGVGALIVSRYPRNLVGWLFLIGQLGNAIGLAADAFAVLVGQGVIIAPGAGRIAGYLSQVFGTVFAVTVMSVIFMIAPDGRLLSWRWRFAVAVPVVAQLLWWLGVVLTSVAAGVPGRETFSRTRAEVAFLAGFSATLLSICLGAIALVLRLRRSTGQQRLQLRWISTGAAALAVIFVPYALSDLLSGQTPWILPVATCLAYIFLSVSVGVAIFRYRLYDIDVILSRAIVLGVLAAFVTVGYIVVVVAIGALLMAFGAPGSNLYWPSLVATALVAVAFQPIRNHVLRLADRLVYGERAAPYEALTTLSRRLADSPSPDALPARVAEATGRAVGAAGVLAGLGRPGEATQVRSAVWSTAGSPGSVPVGAPSLVLPVLDTREQVGSIEVTMPPGRALRTFERNLLEDVAAQTGVAFRNALLESELAARVEQGKAQSAQLEASRRRLIGVEDEARERLADAIQRRVVPHLHEVDTELTTGPAGDHGRPPRELEPLIGAIEAALEELRAVCRGVFPALLDRRGLVPALSGQLARTHPHTLLDVDDAADRRLGRAVEAAAYLFCVEVAPTDRRSVITLRVDDDQLVVAVIGDIAGANNLGAAEGATELTAWQHARDRVAALDGEVTLHRHDHETTVTAVIPLDPGRGRAATMVASRSPGN